MHVLYLIICLAINCRGELSDDEVETWILIGDPSRKQPAIHSKKYVQLRPNEQHFSYSAALCCPVEAIDKLDFECFLTGGMI